MKSSLLALLIFIPLIAIGSDGILDNFLSSNKAAFNQHFNENRDQFVAESFTQGDKFIINFLNNYAKDSDIEEALKRQGDENYLVNNGKELTIHSPSDPETNEYSFSFTRMPDKKKMTYLMFEGNSIIIDNDNNIYFNYGTMRVIVYDNKTNKYRIAAKLENTNYYSYIYSSQEHLALDDIVEMANKYKNPLDKFPCHSLEGIAMPYYQCLGGRLANFNGTCFIFDKNGNILFSTVGIIPPNFVVLHKYQIDWIWKIKEEKLEAITLHWNIHEEPLMDGSDTKTVETVFDMKNH
jgi:hypothetical protein